MSVSINGTGGITFADASTQNTGGYTGFRNRIINGAMMIDQRNAGASVTPTVSGYSLVDRWQTQLSQASKLTFQQNKGSVTPPSGFSSYLGISTASAVSVSSSDYFTLIQTIEGLNVQDLGWGTANAQAVTLSFRVYSSLTGTFGGAIYNSGFNRSYPFTYTVSSSNTWTTISVTISGDTAGTWLTTNGIGLGVSFGLGAGSTYSGTAGAWTAAGCFSATGAVSVVGTLNATFYITGVQLEKGSVATPFEFRPYGQELQLCQRYFQKNNGSIYSSYGAPYNYVLWLLKVTMRASPTITGLGGGTQDQATPDVVTAYTAGSAYAYYTNPTASAEL